MGSFLVEPIMTEISSLIKNDSSPSDYYRMAEILNALVPWPALKAALLDVKLTSSVSRLLHGIAADGPKDQFLLSICGAYLDVFAVLLDPEVCMDPFESQESRHHSDCPGASELGVMVAALFANLHHFSGLQARVLSLLKRIVSMPDGHSILLRGISRWRTAHVAQDTNSDISTGALIEWAVHQLAANELQASQSESVVQYLKSLPFMHFQIKDIAPVERQTAPSRFKSLRHKTQDDARATSEISPSLPECSIEVFWKFVHSFPPYQCKKNWEKWHCTGFDLAVPSQWYTGQSFLTASSRPRDVLFNASIYRPMQEPSDTGSGGMSVTAKPQSDLPPVVALPRRGQESRRMKTGTSSSRPPSIHVDEYHKTEEEPKQTQDPKTSQPVIIFCTVTCFEL